MRECPYSMTSMDRLDYVSTLHGYCMRCCSVASIFGVGVPQRAGHLRVAFLELARVANHLLCVGAHLADLGSLHSLLWLMKERERLMRVTGHLTGSRLHPM